MQTESKFDVRDLCRELKLKLAMELISRAAFTRLMVIVQGERDALAIITKIDFLCDSIPLVKTRVVSSTFNFFEDKDGHSRKNSSHH